jgi:uncharacterized protein YyaL (SSP411 family)
MISAFAKGAQILNEPRYLDAASRAFQFLTDHLHHPSTGLLLRRWRDGHAAIDAFLDDYSALTLAALDLYETTFAPHHLATATTTATRMAALFEDKDHGAFFASPGSHADLVLRLKEDYDGAEPSGNSLAAEALLRLAAHTGSAGFRDAAERIFTAFSSRINQQSITIPRLLCALMHSLAPQSELQLSGPAQPLLDAFRQSFKPFTSVSWNNPSGPPAAVLCDDFVCRPPASTVSELRDLLN